MTIIMQAVSLSTHQRLKSSSSDLARACPLKLSCRRQAPVLAMSLSLLLHALLVLCWLILPEKHDDAPPKSISVRLYQATMEVQAPAKASPPSPVSPAPARKGRQLMSSRIPAAAYEPADQLTPIIAMSEPPAPLSTEGAKQPATSSPAAAEQIDSPTSQPAATLPGSQAPPSAQAVPGSVVRSRPFYRDNPAPDYPPRARRLGQEGTVLLEALVSAVGRVEELAIVGSSGVAALDRAAIAAVRNWLFQPGLTNGRATAMRVRVPVRFALHEENGRLREQVR